MSLTFEILGYWTPYTPSPIPDGIPPAVVFLRSDANVDWYAYRKTLEANNPAGAVYVTAIRSTDGSVYLTQAVQRDLSMVFPLNSLLIRIYGVDPADPKPWAALEQQIFDPATMTLTPPPPAPVAPPSSCTKLGLKRAFDERGLWPTVKAMIASNAEMQEDWDLATQLRISDPIVQQAIAGLAQIGIAFTPDDVQALVTRANELVQ